VRFSEGRVLIDVVQDFRAASANVDFFLNRRGYDWLSAAVDAAAGATHDFDEVVLLVGRFQMLHEIPDGFSAGDDGDVDGGSGDVVGRFADVFQPADVVEFNRRRMAFQDLGDRSERGFHDASGDPENRGRAGVLGQFAIRTDGIELAEFDAFVANQPGDFTCCKDDIDVTVAISAHIGTQGFRFFGNARHDRNRNDVLRI